MVNSQQLQKETATFLNKEVLAIGVFDVSLNAGKRNVAPAATGLAAGLITKQIQKKIIAALRRCRPLGPDIRRPDMHCRFGQTPAPEVGYSDNVGTMLLGVGFKLRRLTLT